MELTTIRELYKKQRFIHGSESNNRRMGKKYPWIQSIRIYRGK